MLIMLDIFRRHLKLCLIAIFGKFFNLRMMDLSSTWRDDDTFICQHSWPTEDLQTLIRMSSAENTETSWLTYGKRRIFHISMKDYIIPQTSLTWWRYCTADFLASFSALCCLGGKVWS